MSPNRLAENEGMRRAKSDLDTTSPSTHQPGGEKCLFQSTIFFLTMVRMVCQTGNSFTRCRLIAVQYMQMVRDVSVFLFEDHVQHGIAIFAGKTYSVDRGGSDGNLLLVLSRIFVGKCIFIGWHIRIYMYIFAR